MGDLVTFAFSILGMALLCLAMPRHREELFGRRFVGGAGRWMRGGGWLGLAAAYGSAVYCFGYGVGTTAWFGHLMLAAVLVVCCLALLRRRKGTPREPS